MKLYLKVIKLITPYWKLMIGTIVLTFLYVFFNNVSLWVSVDFIREIFSPEYVETVQEKIPSADTLQQIPADTTEQEAEIETQTSELDKLAEMKGELDLYDTINHYVRKIIIRKDRQSTLIAVCIVIFLSFLFKNIVHYAKRVLLNYIQLKIIIDLRKKLHRSIIYFPVQYFQKRHSGEITSIVFNDVNAIRHVLNNSFGKMLLSPVQIIANIVILILISWQLSLFTFLVIPVSTWVIITIGKSMRRRSRRVLKQIASVFSVFQEAVSAIRIVKVFTTENKEISRFGEENLNYFRKQFRANRLKFATSPINEILLVMTLIFLLWYGGNMVYANAGLRAEDFIRFLVFLFTMFQPIKDLSGVNNIIQSGMAAAERIFDVIESEPEEYRKPGAKDLAEFSDKIEYKKVNFKYEDNDPYALRNINFEVKKGEMIAFVGHSGSGKTTLINLLPWFYNVSGGEILIDGLNLNDLSLHSLRNKMSMVTQENILFNDTIRNNIAYGVDDASEAAVIKAAKSANAWEFIEKLERGLDSHIGEKGTRLSGGQKQRISIARAILKNPPILILDEATSSLDTESERLVQEAIDKLLESRTVLVIAHRLSTITNADKIVVLNNGQIEDIGTHGYLLKNCSIYRNLSQDQMIISDDKSSKILEK